MSSSQDETRSNSTGGDDELANISEEGTPPTDRFKDASAANGWAVDKWTGDQWHAYDRAIVDDLCDNAPPMSQADLRLNGQGNNFNINFGRAAAKIEMALSSYNDLSNADEHLIQCEIETQIGTPQQREEWAQIYAQGYTRLMRFDWPDFENRMLMLESLFIRSGVAIAFRSNEWDWRWEVSRLGDFQISRRDGCSVNDLECAVQRQFLPPPDVYQWVKDPRIAKKVGWNRAATLKAIEAATVQIGQGSDTYNWQQVQRDSKDGGPWLTTGKDPRVELRHFWVKEFSGKVSHLITSPDNDDDFLFTRRDRWNSASDCFQRETPVLTQDGIFPIHELSGKTVKVKCLDGEWRDASFRSYGEKELWEVALRNGEKVITTKNHRWLTGWNLKEKFTHELEGETIPVIPNLVRPEKNQDYWDGVEHGIVYGDGSSGFDKRSGVFYSYVNLYCHKKELVTLFSPSRSISVNRDERIQSDPEYIRVGTPGSGNLKNLPEKSKSDSYWYGFWCGVMATDGCVSKKGNIILSSSNKDELRLIANEAKRFGILFAGFSESSPKSKYKEDRLPTYSAKFFKKSVFADDLLLSRHRDKFVASLKKNRVPTMLVISVRPLGVSEETFCCEEPITHSFVLGNGLLTGNCMTFFTYGIGNGDFYSIRGLGYKIFALEQMFNILMSRLGDTTLRSMSYLWQPTSADSLQDSNQIVWGADTMIPQGVKPVETFTSNIGQNALQMLNMLSNIESINTGTYTASQQILPGGQPDRKSATQASIEATQEAILTTSAKVLFYQSLDRLDQMTVRALNKREYPRDMPGGEQRWKLMRYCLDRGMPEEAFYNVGCVRHVRSIGMGSPAEQQQKIGQIMSIFPMLDPVAQQLVKRKMVIANLGPDYGDLLVPLTPRVPRDKKDAELESSLFIDGIEPEIMAEEDSSVHLSEHIPFAAGIFQGLQEGEVEPKEAIKRLSAVIPHIEKTFANLQKNPTKKQEIQQYQQVIAKLTADADKLFQQYSAHQQAEADAKAQAQQDLTAEQLEQQRKQQKLDAEIGMKQQKTDADIEISQYATEQKVKHKAVLTETDIQAKKALTATDVSSKARKTRQDLAVKDLTVAADIQNAQAKKVSEGSE